MSAVLVVDQNGEPGYPPGDANPRGDRHERADRDQCPGSGLPLGRAGTPHHHQYGHQAAERDHRGDGFRVPVGADGTHEYPHRQGGRHDRYRPEVRPGPRVGAQRDRQRDGHERRDE